MVAHRVDVARFVLDKVDKGFGTTDIAKEGAINNLVLAIGLFVVATFETLVGFFNDIAGRFLHEEGLNTGGELVGITDAVGGVIFIKEEKFDRDIVFHLVNFVCPMKNIKMGSRRDLDRGNRGRL